MCVTQAAQELPPQPLDCFAATLKTALESHWRVLCLTDELFGFDTDHSPQEGLLAVLKASACPELQSQTKNSLTPL